MGSYDACECRRWKRRNVGVQDGALLTKTSLGVEAVSTPHMTMMGQGLEFLVSKLRKIAATGKYKAYVQPTRDSNYLLEKAWEVFKISKSCVVQADHCD